MITMDKTARKQIYLSPLRLTDKQTMSSFMKEHLELPDYYGGNLDALSDVLSEITQDVVFEADISEAHHFKEEYPGKVLRVISRACEDNPHLHLYLTDKGSSLQE